MQTRPTSQGSDQRKEEFLELMLPLRGRVAQYARSVCRTREEAEDLVSDTILAALEGFDTLRDHTRFRGFVFRIASRIHRRRRWRARLFGSWDPDRENDIPATVSSPELAADVTALRRALNRLPDDQREAVVLFEIVGLSLEEVRRAQGVSIPAVKSRVSRGRKRLAEILGVTIEGERKAVVIVADLANRSNGTAAILRANNDGKHVTSAR